MSCEATAAPSFLDIKSEVGCKKCRLSEGQDVDHKLELVNYGPSEARVKTVGTCSGPRVTYATGKTEWPEEGAIPAGRRAVRRNRSERLALSKDQNASPRTSYEQIDLAVIRAYGSTRHEAPVKLSLQLELRP